jgi:hypothetical protein
MRSAFLTLLLLLPLYAHAADVGAANASSSSSATDASSSSSDADIPPPPTVANNPSDTPPQITIKHKGTNKIEEYRMNGRLYMVRIIPAGGKPYYLIDPKGDGQFVRQDIMNGGLRPPMWVLHQW